MSDFIAHIPAWVWVLFIFLMTVGVSGLFKRTVFLPRLFFMPFVFMVARLKSLEYWEWPIMFAGLSMGLCLGARLGMLFPIRILRQQFSVEIPGSKSTLIILLTYFVFKFTLAVCHMQNTILELILSGVVPGYFLGRSVAYTWRFFNA